MAGTETGGEAKTGKEFQHFLIEMYCPAHPSPACDAQHPTCIVGLTLGSTSAPPAPSHPCPRNHLRRYTEEKGIQKVIDIPSRHCRVVKIYANKISGHSRKNNSSM